MTNEELLEKMKEDIKMRNFSRYSFYTYYHKAEEMMKYAKCKIKTTTNIFIGNSFIIFGGDEESMFRNTNAFTNFSDTYDAILKATQKITEIHKKK